MSDFFAALLARADGRLPVLERRARALFEPAPGTAAPRLALHERASYDDAAIPAAAVAPRDHLAPPAAGAERDAAPEVAAPRTVPTPIPRAVADAATHEASPAERGSLQAPARRPSSVRPASPEVPAEPRVAMREAVSRPADVSHATRPMPPPRQTDVRTTLVRQVATARSEGTVPASPPRAASPATPLPVSLLQRGTPASAVSIAKARADNTSRRDASPAAAPVPTPVQISIGRIEISAVRAGADRPRSVGPAAPRLSLDDYLRGRHNGSTR